MDREELEDNLRKLIFDARVKWGDNVVAAIRKRIQEQSIEDTGVLERSIMREVTEDDVEFFMADYGKFVDEGIGSLGVNRNALRPGFYKNAGGFLKDWAEKRGLNPFAVGRKIEERGGIRPRPFFKSTIEIMVPELAPLLDEAYKLGIDKIIEDANKDAQTSK